MELKVLVAALSLLCVCSAQPKIYDQLLNAAIPYTLPDLPFKDNGLEPYIDAATLHAHHMGHHRLYTNNMNQVLEEWRDEEPDSELARSPILDILERISEVPTKFQTRIRNHGGGFVNHIFYWATMCPRVRAERSKARGSLKKDVESTFGGFDELKEEISQAALKVFGSGYVWLVEDSNERLSIVTTTNQDSPLSSQQYPLLVIDVWEHAYYLKHQYKRSEYIADWLRLICWEEVEQLQVFWRKVAGRVSHSENKTEL